MALRIFTCRDCGHRMRFARDHCGKCYCHKETYQQPMLWYVVIAVLAVLLILGLVQLLSSQI